MSPRCESVQVSKNLLGGNECNGVHAVLGFVFPAQQPPNPPFLGDRERVPRRTP